MKYSFFIALAWFVSVAAPAQKRAVGIPDVYSLTTVSGPVVSPQGKLAYSLYESRFQQPTKMSVVVDGRVVTTDNLSSSPTWSADGKSLYYVSHASGLPQLYRYDVATAASTQLTSYALGLAGPIVSPNGRYIAFAADVYPALGADGKANLEARQKRARSKVQAHVADRLLFRHWTEWADGKYKHIIVFDTEAQTYTDVTPGAFHSPTFSPSGAEGFAFSPDSREICYLSNHTANPEANTNSDLWLVGVDGSNPRCITAENEAWDGSPQYSPDGRYIAYRMQRVPGYESDRFLLCLYDRTTGAKRVLTESFDNWVNTFKWAADSKSIYFLGSVTGYEPLHSVDIRSGRIRTVIPARAISSFDVDPKGGFYYTYSTTGKPTALYHRDSKGRERQLSHYNDSLEAEVDFRPSETAWVIGADGDSVEVFIVKPHDFDPQKKYPLIINVHGGPQMQWMDSFRADWQVYPGAGYVVAYPNPHGSTGRGQAFCRAISGSFGGRPYDDVMAVTDYLEKLPYVDANRIGAMGWSYGGYFMNWLQAKTNRYACLASMMGLYDLKSMWGTTEELWFPNFDMEGQPWNSDLYEKYSPSEYVGNFSTPTLILTGELDYRVSYTQSLQYFTTLQTLGVPSRLIVFPNDGHWPGGHSLMLYYNAHLEWFHKYLGGAPAPWDSERMAAGEAF